MRSTVVAVVAVAAALHAAVLVLSHDQIAPPGISGQLASVSFSPVNPDRNGEQDLITEEQIRSDMQVIAPYTRGIRTYSATNGMKLVPGIAAEFDRRVTLGAWINKTDKQNESEITSVIDLARRHGNIDSIIVGNEALLRKDISVPELIANIQRVKREVSVPVSTAEVWNFWLEHPELASSVDFIAVHILPYWEGKPGSVAVDHAIAVYEKLRQTFPGKRIVIAEFGWPSGGLNRKEAIPSPLTQAQVIRDFVSRAEAWGIEYMIVEAFDQPWKTFEGSVGPYWGLFDSRRQPKFAFEGTVYDHNWLSNLLASVAFGVILSLPIFKIREATIGQASLLAAAANVTGAWLWCLIAYWMTHYFVLGSQVAMVIGTCLLLPLILVLMQRIDELASIVFGAKPKRLLIPAASGFSRTPLVSLHIPACREPPEMLKQTLDSVAKLDWPALECVVVINNTSDAAIWRPVEEHCKLLGNRFKFLYVERLEGFKAGALRLALHCTSPQAEIIGVLDADYVVHPDWLKDVVPTFADPAVGLVQAPQDHRDRDRSVVHTLMDREYAGFFDIGMVQRNESGAIVTHGTMCLIRRSALMDAGNWSSDTLVEDADLGLTLLERGWHAHYTQRRYGWGLLPESFAAYKKQRHRWAYGGVQLIKKHWRAFLPNGSRLTFAQKAEFALGWLIWLGAETLGIVLAIFNLLWMPLVAFFGIAVPEAVLTVPVLATFFVILVHVLVLYRNRVKAPLLPSLGAALAGMALQLSIGKAVADGIRYDELPFHRTSKGTTAPWSSRFPALWETALGAMLILGSVTLMITNEQEVHAISIYSAVMLVQSLPFLAAVAMALLERSSLNDFATWRRIGGFWSELAGHALGSGPPTEPQATLPNRRWRLPRRTLSS